MTESVLIELFCSLLSKAAHGIKKMLPPCISFLANHAANLMYVIYTLGKMYCMQVRQNVSEKWLAEQLVILFFARFWLKI